MKLVIVGFGQCGGRIADEFARLNTRARGLRRLDIITSAFAVNTDIADLSGLHAIKSNYDHRILIGSRKTGGHGVGKINELGAEVAREDADKVVETIRSARRFAETDAFLLIAGAAGGTGSGSIPVMTQQIKERYVDKPVYNLIVLPFEQQPNPYITPALCFQFHYFAIRKMHLLMRAKSLVAFPGGYGTLDELFETLTLIQTQKIKPMPVLLFGKAFWERIINFEALLDEGVISEKDLNIFQFVETAAEAWETIAAANNI